MGQARERQKNGTSCQKFVRLDLHGQVVAALLESLRGANLCFQMLPNAMLCHAMLCYAMLCYAMLCLPTSSTLALRMPKPNSALSSKRELAHAGPSPLEFTVYGKDGLEPPQMEEQPQCMAISNKARLSYARETLPSLGLWPVALAMTSLSPNLCQRCQQPFARRSVS